MGPLFGFELCQLIWLLDFLRKCVPEDYRSWNKLATVDDFLVAETGGGGGGGRWIPCLLEIGHCSLCRICVGPPLQTWDAHSIRGRIAPMKIALTLSCWSRRHSWRRTPIMREHIPCTIFVYSVHDNLLFKTIIQDYNPRWRWCSTCSVWVL